MTYLIDGVLLVVDSGRIRGGQRCKERLDKVGANLLGITLNKLGAACLQQTQAVLPVSEQYPLVGGIEIV